MQKKSDERAKRGDAPQRMPAIPFGQQFRGEGACDIKLGIFQRTVCWKDHDQRQRDYTAEQ